MFYKKNPSVHKIDIKKIDIEQIKTSVIADLKNLSLEKKDRVFLLQLIELYDSFAIGEEEKFLSKLQRLIIKHDKSGDTEFEARIYSLKKQLDENKYSEIRHFPHFSIYFQKGKIDFYPKKTPLNWDILVNELKKIDFEKGSLKVYKSISRKNLISSLTFKQSDIETRVIGAILANVFTNTHITLHLKKEEL